MDIPTHPRGLIWVCGACGRWERDRHDLCEASCFLHAAQIDAIMVCIQGDRVVGTMRVKRSTPTERARVYFCVADWKDETTYGRGRRGIDEPSVWALYLENGARLSVHRFLQCEGWFWSCSDVAVSGRPLTCPGLGEAKVEAMTELRAFLNRFLDALEQAAR